MLHSIEEEGASCELQLIAIDGIRGSLVDTVREDASRWPLLYLPSLIGALLVGGMLWHVAHAGWLHSLRRGRSTP